MPVVEHRSASRVRSFLRGEIIHSNDASKTECTVRDMSEGGARIEAPSSVTVPEYFDLVIPQRGTRQHARIIWRHGSELGVSFQEKAHSPIPVPVADEPSKELELKLRMIELEAETAKLRAQLAEMRDVVASLVREKRSA